MKKTTFLLTLLLLGAACKGDNDLAKTDTKRNNANANSTAKQAEYGRLEFPRLRGAGNRVLIHNTADGQMNYAVEWNDAKKAQRWSCYQLYSSNLVKGPGVKRYRSTTNQYPQDPLLPEALRFAQDPYWRSGYDHGHICPSNDRLYTSEANYQTFFMTNMQPQNHEFNAGVWEHMESAVREIAKRNGYSFCDTLYVCKGGTIDNEAQYTKTGRGLIVPQYFFMAIMRVKNGVYNAFGFWVEHLANNDRQLAKYAVSIQELEKKTGIDFFCNLPDDKERVVEAAPVNTNLWGLK